MYPELILVIAIIIFLFIYNKVISVKGALDANNSAIKYLKESDYDFLLIAKYGDLVYAPNEVFMKRIKQGLTWGILAFFVATLTGKMTFITFIICIAVGYIAFKKQYLDLKSFYKSHLNQIDSLLPYYLKGLEILIHHYTVPVALAKSIDDAPEVFKPGLRRMIDKIEAGDSSVDPYMDFAKEYPVRDSMRMMRLLYRLGLGSQENKQEQLMMFSRTVSQLQNKAREQKYKDRLEKMEKKTMLMLCCTGGGIIFLLLLSMTQMMGL